MTSHSVPYPLSLGPRGIYAGPSVTQLTAILEYNTTGPFTKTPTELPRAEIADGWQVELFSSYQQTRILTISE